MKPTPPILLHIPHASRLIPHIFRPDYLLSTPELEQELDVMTDAYTDELFVYDGPGSTILCAPVSRLVVDVERFRDDAQEPMTSRGMGVIYTRTHDCRPLRGLPGESCREELLRRYYDPHHRQLNSWAEQALSDHGRCLLIDCHSFPSAPRYYEHEGEDLPDFCIGTDSFHTPERDGVQHDSWWIKTTSSNPHGKHGKVLFFNPGRCGTRHRDHTEGEPGK